MENELQEYLTQFEEKLLEQLIKQLSSKSLLGGYGYTIEELDEVWRQCRAEYVADAMPEIAKYPLAATAWAAYVGIGCAIRWDRKELGEATDATPYFALRDARGFDELDEYVEYLMLDSGFRKEQIEKIGDALRSAAQTAIDAIRHENIEPQTVRAFHAFARCAKVMFTIGVGIALYEMGYSYQKATVELPS